MTAQRNEGRSAPADGSGTIASDPLAPEVPSARERARAIPEAAVARLAVYLRVLSGMAEQGVGTISSEELAAAAGVNSAKLRKDLSYIGSYGTRGVGYDVEVLVDQIERILGLTRKHSVAVVGIGNLGHALANYGGFPGRASRWPPSSTSTRTSWASRSAASRSSTSTTSPRSAPSAR